MDAQYITRGIKTTDSSAGSPLILISTNKIKTPVHQLDMKKKKAVETKSAMTKNRGGMFLPLTMHVVLGYIVFYI